MPSAPAFTDLSKMCMWPDMPRLMPSSEPSTSRSSAWGSVPRMMNGPVLRWSRAIVSCSRRCAMMPALMPSSPIAAWYSPGTRPSAQASTIASSTKRLRTIIR